MVKAIFFDIDGTLVSFKTHKIPASTVEALKRIKEKGIKIIISTGRPVALINNLDEIKDMISGYITNNGGYCFVGDKVLASHPIPLCDIHTLMRVGEELNFATMIIGEHDYMIHNPTPMVDEIFVKLLNVQDIDYSITAETVLKQNVYQLTPLVTPEQQEILMSQMTESIAARWHPDFADVTHKDADKGSAMLEMCKKLGIKPEETIAFGDGGNDITIIKAAGTGIAMGNAGDDVKQSADYITASVDDDGVMKALDIFVK